MPGAGADAGAEPADAANQKLKYIKIVLKIFKKCLMPGACADAGAEPADAANKD